MKKLFVINGHVNLEYEIMFYGGSINVDMDTGKFNGRTHDICQKTNIDDANKEAEISGEITVNGLNITKKYVRVMNGKNPVIIFNFTMHYTNIGNMAIPLGFWGYCEYDDGGERVRKVASCVLLEI